MLPGDPLKAEEDGFYQNYFSEQDNIKMVNSQTKTGVEKHNSGCETPEWMRRDREETDTRGRMAKKPNWGPPVAEPANGWAHSVGPEKALLGLTIVDFFNLHEQLADEERLKIMLKGDRWVRIRGEEEQLSRVCNSIHRKKDIDATSQRMKAWAQSQGLYLREPLNHKKKAEKFSGPDLMDIDPKDLEGGGGLRWRSKKRMNKNASERDILEGGPQVIVTPIPNSWATLRKNIFKK